MLKCRFSRSALGHGLMTQPTEGDEAQLVYDQRILSNSITGFIYIASILEWR